MKTLVIVLMLAAMAATASANVIVVEQVNLTFVPSEITINVGDTVIWNHTGGSHTVTNGTGAVDPQAGSMFDMPLTTGSVSFVFATPGDVPYFCRPHESFGMLGLIHVNAPVANEAMSFAAVKRLYR